MTDPIKEKIISLVPDILRCNGGSPCSCETITLADVLRALGKPFNGTITFYLDGTYATFDSLHMDKPKAWNLAADYDGQTQEVKDFIGKLLGV